MVFLVGQGPEEEEGWGQDNLVKEADTFNDILQANIIKMQVDQLYMAVCF